MRNQKKRILSSEKGFTLFELVMVMAVIAILAAVAYPVYAKVRDNAYVSQAKAILQQVRVDVWSYFLENGRFPQNLDDLGNYDKSDWDLWGNADNQNFVAVAQKSGTTFQVSMTLKPDGTVDWSR